MPKLASQAALWYNEPINIVVPERCVNILWRETNLFGRLALSHYNTSGVYIITNLINGKRYIGSSYNMQRRWNEHRSVLNNNRGTNRILQNAWNFYGSDAFSFSVLEYVEDHSLLVPIEQRYLDALLPEYNVRKIADRCTGLKRTPEARAKMRAAKLGKTYSDEYKANMSSVMKGRQFTPEWIEHLKEAQARRVITDEDKAEFQHRMNDPEIVAKRNAATLNNGRVKLTWEKVDEIRSLHASGQYSGRGLAKKYGVSPAVISTVITGRTWKPENDPRRREIHGIEIVKKDDGEV